MEEGWLSVVDGGGSGDGVDLKTVTKNVNVKREKNAKSNSRWEREEDGCVEDCL